MKMAKDYQYHIFRFESAQLTKLDDDLPEIVGVPGPHKEPHVADFSLVLRFAPENVFLNIRNTFHEKANNEQYHACDVSPCAKLGLVELRYIG